MGSWMTQIDEHAYTYINVYKTPVYGLIDILEMEDFHLLPSFKRQTKKGSVGRLSSAKTHTSFLTLSPQMEGLQWMNLRGPYIS